MYDYLQGTLVEVLPGYLVLDVGGVGYKISVTSRLAERANPLEGHSLKLYVFLVIREESQTLYGFLDKIERSLFEILLSVSGIGPRTALAILGALTVSALQKAVTLSDLSSLIQVPGIGKKTAERLLLELRGRLDHLPIDPIEGEASVQRDASLALVRLGYSMGQAETVLRKARELSRGPLDLPSWITAALKLPK